MKKTYAKIVAIIAMVVIMLAGNSALAYTGDGFSIDMPSTYTSGGSNSWANTSSKATVNVQVLDNTAGETISQESLQESVDSLKSAYSGIVIEKSEITKLNGMDALHIASNVSSMYLEQYVVVTSSKVFVLTMGAYDKSYLSSSEATSILGSFKVNGASSSNTGYTGNGNNTNKTFTKTCRATEEGEIVFTLTGDITEANASDPANPIVKDISESVTVNIAEAPIVTPSPSPSVTPTPSTTPKPSTKPSSSGSGSKIFKNPKTATPLVVLLLLSIILGSLSLVRYNSKKNEME